MIQNHTKMRSVVAAYLAALGFAVGCSATPTAPRLAMESNAAAFQRDGRRLLAHVSPEESDDARPAGAAASHQSSIGDEQ